MACGDSKAVKPESCLSNSFDCGKYKSIKIAQMGSGFGIYPLLRPKDRALLVVEEYSKPKPEEPRPYYFVADREAMSGTILPLIPPAPVSPPAFPDDVDYIFPYVVINFMRGDGPIMLLKEGEDTNSILDRIRKLREVPEEK